MFHQLVRNVGKRREKKRKEEEEKEETKEARGKSDDKDRIITYENSRFWREDSRPWKEYWIAW